MFDIKWIRDNPDAFDKGLQRRGLPLQSAELIALDAKRREAQTAAQEIQAERNRLAKEIGAAKAKGENADAIIAKVSETKTAEAEAEKAAADAEAALKAALALVPNMPAEDVPDGPDESANRVERVVGDKPQFDFEPKEHFDIGEALGMMDFETAAKIAGARFVLLSGALARMERALANFMLDLHTAEHGLTEVNPPVLVNDATVFGTGQLPKFAEDLFQTTFDEHVFLQGEEVEIEERSISPDQKVFDVRVKDPNDVETAQILAAADERKVVVGKRGPKRAIARRRLWLIPTAEVPLTNIVAGEIVDEAYLPRRYAALTPCFRSEAGSAGKDTRGMLRQHQFAKVEMVTVCTPETSWDELERMTKCAEEVLKRLGIPYRVVTLSTGDMGFGAAKTYDIEVWLPGQGAYREISSCSNCVAFQARRMKARYRPQGEKKEGKGTRFVHTLNGSGLAVGRTLIAVLENYQRADGSVVVPETLRPYMGGLETITRNGG